MLLRNVLGSEAPAQPCISCFLSLLSFFLGFGSCTATCVRPQCHKTLARVPPHQPHPPGTTHVRSKEQGLSMQQTKKTPASRRASWRWCCRPPYTHSHTHTHTRGDTHTHRQKLPQRPDPLAFLLRQTRLPILQGNMCRPSLSQNLPETLTAGGTSPASWYGERQTNRNVS